MFTIYFTSDIHGYFFPTDYKDQKKKPLGAFELWQDMQRNKNTLLLDGGDSLQGSPFLFYYQRQGKAAQIAAGFYNAADYDYYTLGNHDFNYGYETLATYIENMKAKLVCANVRDRSGRLSISPYAIHTMGDGTRVGIAGIVTHWVNIWERPENLENWEISHPIPAARKALEALKEKVDFTILIYHGGVEEDLKTGERLSDTDENLGAQLARELDYDLILTGHQHMPFAGMVLKGTHIVQSPAEGKGYVEIKVEAGQIHSKLQSPTKINSILTEKYAPLEEAVQNYLDETIAILPKDLLPKDRITMALQGSKLADFINQVQLDYSGADISATSFANEIPGLKKNLTLRDVILSYPFPNTLVILTINGNILKRALEHNSTYLVKEASGYKINRQYLVPKEEHYNFDYFYPLQYEVDYDQPEGHRIHHLKLHGKPIKANQILTIALNNYRSTGTGGFNMYKEALEKREIPKEIQEMLIETVSSKKKMEDFRRRWNS